MFSWGSNSHSQLGLDCNAEQYLLPKQIKFNIKANNIVGGGKHTILLSTRGEIYVCGDNDKGQLGKELTIKLLKIFQPLQCPFKVIEVACGWDFNLALIENNEVLGWGSNSFGQLGFSVKKASSITTPLKIFKNAVAIGAGLRHSAIVNLDGLIFTSGFGKKGQLGVIINGKVPLTVEYFVQVQNIENCQAISCGECHCIAKDLNGKIFSWGNNRHGQLGINPQETLSVNTPILLSIPLENKNLKKLSSGWAHNLVLTEEGKIISWGRNDFGQLGESRMHFWKPQVMSNIKKIKQICVGSHHSMAMTETGEVFTWGWNEHGNCGNGNCDNVLKPFKINLEGIKFIGSGIMDLFKNLLEINNPNLEPTFLLKELPEIPIIENTFEYSEFFESFLLLNIPCIVENVSETWPCAKKWIKNRNLNTDYFRSNLKNSEVPVSDCSKREFNVQKKYSMKLYNYLEYWDKYKTVSGKTDCLYLKDWHFTKEYPNSNIYRVPNYFASDWLNEYYDNNLHLNDDYRFVYIGPKGSWTPFHADVFHSYSWSVNISGRKKWILMPPGAEINFQDALGNLYYDIDFDHIKKKKTAMNFPIFEIIQKEGQGLFVPSGWHHQVWNLEDTISINHNWINGCNIQHIWETLKKNLSDVIKEISDCRDMENWAAQCQLVLASSFGINYQFFHSFLVETAKSRIKAIKAGQNINVRGKWFFGKNHMIFDLKRIFLVLKQLEEDENYLQLLNAENDLEQTKYFSRDLIKVIEDFDSS